MAEWSCSGLQSRLRRFDSDSRLQNSFTDILTGRTASMRAIMSRPGGEIGRRTGLKIPGRKACGFESRPGHHKLHFLAAVSLRSQAAQ